MEEMVEEMTKLINSLRLGGGGKYKERFRKNPYGAVSKIPYEAVSKFSIEKSKMHSTESQKIEPRPAGGGSYD